LLLRGHNFPGGGFIAGLLTAAVIGLQYMAFGIDWVDRRLPLNLYGFIVLGLSLALLTGVGSFFFEKPFLTSAVQELHFPVLGHFHFVTAFFFDLGVYFAVVGVVLSIFHLLGEEKSWN
jgi:multicomponent K+:H+ antiporter subunit A